MIIIGYQGVGKSTFVKENDNSIDLESSNFWFKGEDGKNKRYFNWAEIYVNIALDISSQSCIVFTASHQAVRDELAKPSRHHNEDIAVLVPSLELKDAWIQKLKDRYEESKLSKDYKAWKNAEDRYSENINELVNDAHRYGWDVITIDDMDYNLTDVMYNYFDR